MQILSTNELFNINGGMMPTGIFYNYIGKFLKWYSKFFK